MGNIRKRGEIISKHTLAPTSINKEKPEENRPCKGMEK